MWSVFIALSNILNDYLSTRDKKKSVCAPSPGYCFVHADWIINCLTWLFQAKKIREAPRLLSLSTSLNSMKVQTGKSQTYLLTSLPYPSKVVSFQSEFAQNLWHFLFKIVQFLCTYRFPFSFQLLDVAHQLWDDLCWEVLGDDLVLPSVVIQLVQRHQERSAGGVPDHTCEHKKTSITPIITLKMPCFSILNTHESSSVFLKLNNITQITFLLPTTGLT